MENQKITFERPKFKYNIGDYVDFEVSERGKRIKIKGLVTDIVICLHLAKNITEVIYQVSYYYKGEQCLHYIKKMEFENN
ncbi:MAG: hypothetical protein RMJ97_11330 [Raineya sp.]|nr:hypothetical protein [Raineya sp.]